MSLILRLLQTRFLYIKCHTRHTVYIIGDTLNLVSDFSLFLSHYVVHFISAQSLEFEYLFKEID